MTSRRLAALLVVLSSSPALAQGLPDARTGQVIPQAQSAAVDDAFALDVNPAGLAFVDSFVFQGGYTGRLVSNEHDLDAAIAVGVLDGIGLGGGVDLVLVPTQLPTVVGSLGAAARVGRMVSFGTALRAVNPLRPGGRGDLRLDVGTQLRPARFIAIGAGIEDIIGRAPSTPAVRAGVSLRPFAEWATLGVDVRARAGSRDPFTSAFATGATIEPGVVLRFDLGGFGLTLGGSLEPLGIAAAATPKWAVNASIEVNAEHFGATLLGGSGSSRAGATVPFEAQAGAFLRVSGASYDSVFPGGGTWRKVVLRGPGVPPNDESLIASLFSEQPSPEVVLAVLQNMAEDDDIEGVVLRFEGLSLGWGPAADLRSAIDRLRAAGKQVVVHTDGGDDVEVFVASAADKFWLSPSGQLAFDGVRVVMTYAGEALSRFGIGVEAVAAGEYKSAPRVFTADEPNAAELEVQNAILDGVYGALVANVAKGRGLSEDDVKAVIDLGGLTADEALEKKIVDGLAYEDELPDLLESLTGHAVRLLDGLPDDDARVVRWDEPDAIALIPILGEIRMGRSDPGLPGLVGISAGAEDVVEAIEEARRDPSVKAIVLRIDSPGGDALASDLIWRAALRARDEKPVIASMGEVAASGGYYIAAAANEIYAEPGTITGSIGVFSLMFHVDGLASDLGVSAYELQRGARPGPTIFRGMTEAERARVTEQVEDTYERFLDAVAKGRNMDKEAVRKVAGGHVWLGSAAKDHKLVDAIGGIVDALERARALANLPKDEPIGLSILTGKSGGMLGLATFLTLVQGQSRQERVVRAVGALLGDPAEALSVLEQGGRAQARMPWRIEVR